MWDFRRKGWTFRSGGDSADAASGSGLFKSTDGGATWKDWTKRAQRAARQALGPRRGVRGAVKARRRVRVHRSRDPEDGALPLRRRRQDLAGSCDRSNWMVWRPFYFANLIVDPKDENKIYKPDLC